VSAPPELELLALEPLEPTDALLTWLADELRARLGFRRVVVRALPLDGSWVEPDGSRLSSNRLVDALVDRAEDADLSHTERWTLAVTDRDLTAPGRDYVFGEATLGGGWAVLGTARLAPADAPEGEAERHRRRILVEAIHELGHLAGLRHCDSEHCAMNPSVTAEDTDRKHLELCTRCRTPDPDA
jgi:archaemetzincin